MASTVVRACVRCHYKKIRCSGYRQCQNCTSAGVLCEPYRRQKKRDGLEALKFFKDRTEWLEEQLRQRFSISVKDVATGTPLQFSLDPETATADSEIPQRLTHPEGTISPSSNVQRQKTSDAYSPANDASEISLVTLNATGEIRYLGPSSGISFASYATTLARSYSSSQGSLNACTAGRRHGVDDTNNVRGDESQILSSDECQVLLRSYRMWIEPLYPVLDPEALDILVGSCLTSQSADTTHPVPIAEQNMERAIFYLVMALGAINVGSFIKQLQVQPQQGSFQDLSVSKRSAADFYRNAIKCVDVSAQHLVPSVPFIQILLLISIYSSYEPVASSQWQLTGMAMRMAIEIGMHNPSRASGLSESAKDQRNRVFWSAYAIEISLAYNLGRPPSIGEEHITAEKSNVSSTTLFSSLHIRHRQIQSRVVSQVYCINNKARSMREAQNTIARLQEELDEWKSTIPQLSQPEGDAPYPYSFWVRLYHGTSFVLHRSSPLCPSPSRESLGKCLQSAGAYIEDILELLRESNVPLSWMLVQGVLFAGLRILIMARTGFKQLDPHVDLLSLLVDLPAWTRKCSVCLAIMNERWCEDLLSRLHSQFEILVNDTLRLIYSTVTSPGEIDTLGDVSVPWQSAMTAPTLALDDFSFQDAPIPDGGLTGACYDFELMRDIMGFDPTQTFWDTFPPG